MLTPEQRETLKGASQGANFDPSAQPGGNPTPQPTAEAGAAEFQDGESYTFRDGQFTPFEPPTPGQHSENSGRFAPAREKTLADLRGNPNEWPDITAR